MGGPVHCVDGALKHTVGMLLRARGVTDYARLREKPLVVQIDTLSFEPGGAQVHSFTPVITRVYFRAGGCIFSNTGGRAITGLTRDYFPTRVRNVRDFL